MARVHVSRRVPLWPSKGLARSSWTMVSIRSVDGSLSVTGGDLELAGAGGSFEIHVLMPEICAVTVDAKVLTKPDG